MLTTQQYYRITFPDGSTYYGRTTQLGNKRYIQHLSSSKLGKHDNKHIQEVYNKYGSDGWVHEWLGTETGDLEYHNKIEYGYVKSDPKSLNIHNGNWDHSKYNSKRMKAKYDSWGKEEWDEYKRKQREYYHKRKLKNEII